MKNCKLNLMRKFVVFSMLVFMIIMLPNAYADGTPGRTLDRTNQVAIQSAFNSVGGETQILNATVTYDTYTYTHSDILIFSYTDGTQFEVYDSSSTLVWSGTVNNGGHKALSSSDDVSTGVYNIRGTNPYGVIVGDEVSSYVMGYYAFDKDGKGLSTKFYTYQVDTSSFTNTNYRNFIVFGYEDSTSVEITNTETGTTIWSGTLNAGEHHAEPSLSNIYLTVTSSKPVSALSYTDQGYYVPAASGTFYGKSFYTWIGTAGEWTHDLNIIAYSDSTSYTVTNTETGTLVGSGTLNAGEVGTMPFYNAQYVTITTDKDVNVGVMPYISYSSYYYSIHAQDTSGTGIGTLFYYPTLVGGQMVILSYSDNTLVSVTDSSGTELWSGYLNAGEYRKLTNATNDVYKIVGTNLISIVYDYGDAAGADFAPQYYATPTTPSVTLNNPNGGEVWTVGSSQNIAWVASGGTGSLSVDLYYSTTGLNGTYSPIAIGLPNTGSYSWTVPNAPSTNVFVKAVVTDASSNTANDTSDAAFTIESAVASQLLVTINQIDNTSFDTITAYVSVTNQNNTPISGLTEANFSVTENSTCTPTITVSPISTIGTPVSLAMTVDYSGSMSAANIADAKTGLANFISLGGASDRFAIVKFSTDVEVVQNFTSNKTLLQNQVNSMSNYSSGWTSLYDSIYDSVTLVNSESHRKAVIAFTDGDSNDDVHSLTEAINYAKVNNVPVYTIGLGSVSTTILQQIANETGGVYYYAPTSSELVDIYAQISEHISNQYEITYQTCNSNYGGTYRDVEVSVTYSGLTGSKTSGYYAPSSISSLTVTLVTPTSGPVGTAVSIGGNGFVSGSTVTVGGVTATSTVISSSEITATVPTSLSAGTYDIVVTNPDTGYGALSNGFEVTSSTQSSNYSLSAYPTSVSVGESITVTFTAPGNQNDWISIYNTSAGNSAVGEWYYLNGRSSGTLTFIAPTTTGNYEFRLFQDWPTGGYTDIATSNTITVIDTTITQTLATDNVNVSNDYIDIVVAPSGEYTIGTIEGDPTITTDNNKMLLYGHPNPWSSYLTVRIDGVDYYTKGDYIDSYRTSGPTASGSSINTVWSINDILITQTISITTSTSTGREDTAMFKISLKNTGTTSKTVGARFLFDTKLGLNDGAPFRVPGIGDVTTEREFNNRDVPVSWQSFDSLTSPTVISQGTLSTQTPPNRFIMAYWSYLYNAPWDYTVQWGNSYNNDSATATYWNPITIQAGSKVEYTTAYGIGGITMSTGSGDLSLGVSAPSSAESGDVFSITAYIQNTGTASVDNINALINVPTGLSLISGETSQKSVGTLTAGDDTHVTWNVQATSEGTYNVSVDVSGSNVQNTSATRTISVSPSRISTGTVTRSLSSSTVQTGDTLDVTLTPSPSASFDSPGYQVTEIIPSGFVFNSTGAAGVTHLGNIYTFTQIGSTTITYSVTAPSSNGTYSLSGTFKDELRNTGDVSGTTSIIVGTASTGGSYDLNYNGIIEKSEAVQAVMDYFSGLITRDEAIAVVMEYFTG